MLCKAASDYFLLCEGNTYGFCMFAVCCLELMVWRVSAAQSDLSMYGSKAPLVSLNLGWSARQAET